MNQQIIQQPFLYVNNLPISWASNTTLTIGSGQCRDSQNITDFTISSPITLNGSVNGVNGLDTGSLAAATLYAIYIIGDTTLNNSPVGIISTSTTGPLLPSGYDTWRLIGWAITRDSLAQFVVFYNSGNGNTRTFTYDTSFAVLSGGNAATFTTVSCLYAVPPVDNTLAWLDVTFTPNVAGHTVSFRPTGSSATAVVALSGVVAAVAQEAPLTVLTKLSSGIPHFDYKNSSASDATSVNILGFTYYV